MEPNSAIAVAAGFDVSGSRVGSHINSSSKPIATFETPLGVYPYLLDIIPNLSGGRVINLTAEPDKSAGLTLMTSYLSSDSNESSKIDTDEVPPIPTPPTSYERSHTLLVQFGAGEVRHSFEIDVAEGSTANCPGHQVEVSLLDYTFSRAQDASIDPAFAATLYTGLRSFASVASGVAPIPGRVTQKVYTFFQVEVDLAAPPSLGEFKRLLSNAVMDRILLYNG